MVRRRHRLVPKGAIECYEIRIVASLAESGVCVFAEVTAPPGGDLPDYTQMLGALERAKIELIKLYEEDE